MLSEKNCFGYIHVVIRGRNRNVIFRDDEDHLKYLECIYRYASKYNVDSICFCVLDNHAHFLFKVYATSDLGKCMQHANSVYARYFNKKYNATGHLYDKSYSVTNIDSVSHLKECIQYIYNNPVKAGICSNRAEYKYSNYPKDFNIEIFCSSLDLNGLKDKGISARDIVTAVLKRSSINGKLPDYELGQAVKVLKDKYDISFRKMADVLKLDRKKVARLYNKLN